jgi:hypothetical protein
MLLSLVKRFWKEFLIVILAILTYFGWKREPKTVEVTKVEYVDRVIEKEKIVTVEKKVASNKKRRTTVEKPDGTKVVTEVTEEKNTDTKVDKDEKIDTKESIKTETTTSINQNSYSINLAYTHYKEQTIAASINFRLGQLPILVGPHVIYNLETKKTGIGLNIQFQI